MIRSLLRLATALLVLVSTACATQSVPRTGSAPTTVLLISMDGVRPDYLGRGDTPNLDRIANEGVRAEWMTPSYPTLTFPNHYTIVTGLRPDRHGIVHNAMQDADLGRFALSDRDAVGNGEWWGGQPVWVLAERAGLPTATLAWPGSEAPVQGVRPTRWHLFDANRSIAERIDIVSAWLLEPATTRPRLATLYFEHPDSAAHGHGPDSPELRAAIRDVDAAIGELLQRLERNGALDRVDMVIVSDHGMAAVPQGQVVALEDMVADTIAAPVMAGQVVGFAPLPGHEAAAEAALLGRHAQYECWRKGEMPARWHYGSHPRIPPIVCQMDKGWDAYPRQYITRLPERTRGSHGFDPAEPDMRAVFIARGPSFANATILPAFDNVDVFPLLARLLGLEAPENDGNPDTLLPALREQGGTRH